MQSPISRAALLITSALFVTAPALAHNDDSDFCPAVAAAEVAVAADASLQVMYPSEGTVVRSSDFTILLKMEGDLAGAALDHVHWKIDDGFNNTAADLTGVIDVTDLADGTHTLTTYMATVDHIPINGKKIVTFRVVTNGVSVLSPENQSVLKSNDVTVYYEIFGDPGRPTFVKARLDDGAPLADWDGDGQITFTSLSDGEHEVKIWRSDFTDETVGDESEVEFVVASTLNPTNASSLRRSLKKVLKEKGKTRIKLWKSMKKLLQEMEDGGEQHSVIAGLNHANVTAARKAIEKVVKLESKVKLNSKEKIQLLKSQDKAGRLIKSLQN